MYFNTYSAYACVTIVNMGVGMVESGDCLTGTKNLKKQKIKKSMNVEIRGLRTLVLRGGFEPPTP